MNHPLPLPVSFFIRGGGRAANGQGEEIKQVREGDKAKGKGRRPREWDKGKGKEKAREGDRGQGKGKGMGRGSGRLIIRPIVPLRHECLCLRGSLYLVTAALVYTHCCFGYKEPVFNIHMWCMNEDWKNATQINATVINATGITTGKNSTGKKAQE